MNDTDTESCHCVGSQGPIVIKFGHKRRLSTTNVEKILSKLDLTGI